MKFTYQLRPQPRRQRHTFTRGMASFAALPALAPFPRLASRVPGKLAGRALRARAQVPRNCRADSPFVRVRASASADPGDAARLINRVPKPRRGFATATAAFALTVALAVFPAEQADAKLVNIQIDPATLTTRACDDPRAGGVPGSATYKVRIVFHQIQAHCLPIVQSNHVR